MLTIRPLTTQTFVLATKTSKGPLAEWGRAVTVCYRVADLARAAFPDDALVSYGAGGTAKWGVEPVVVLQPTDNSMAEAQERMFRVAIDLGSVLDQESILVCRRATTCEGAPLIADLIDAGRKPPYGEPLGPALDIVFTGEHDAVGYAEPDRLSEVIRKLQDHVTNALKYEPGGLTIYRDNRGMLHAITAIPPKEYDRALAAGIIRLDR